ncbi:hypothetical protein MNBD_ALPHA04-552, partial [hydrothermal vent metagenome]
ETPRKQIIVDGEATIEVEPELFTLSASIRSRTDKQSAALAEISDKLAVIRDSLPQLEGLTHLTVDASEAVIRPIQDRECLERAGYGDRESCSVTGYFSSVAIKVKGSPANLSGYALSLLSELGAEEVSLKGYAIADIESARKSALDKAVEDARAKAVGIANASGATLVGPIRIQYGEGFGDASAYGSSRPSVMLGLVEVSASRDVIPETELDLEPQPIKISEKVVAAFEIE